MKELIFRTVRIIFQLINGAIFIRIILSWLPIGQNVFTTLIYNLTEPLLKPIRELIKKSPLGGMMIDFSPLILVFLLSLIERLIFTLLLII